MKKTIFSLAIVASLFACEVKNDDSVTPTSVALASGKPEDNPTKTKDDNGNKTTTTTGTAISMTSVVGGADWKVNSYVDNKNRDRTSRYAAFSFGFVADGSVVVKSGVQSYATGKWRALADGTKEKFYLTLQTTDGNLLELNEDWLIVSKTATQFKLQNVSGGNGGTTTLILSR